MSNIKVITFGLIFTLLGLAIFFRRELKAEFPINLFLVQQNTFAEHELGGRKITKKKKIKTIADVNQEFASRVESSLKPVFKKIGLSYPPQKIALLFFKQEKKMELWIKTEIKWVFAKEYQIKAASGIAGPKLKEGDFQVPEGIYKIELLNPNSSYHVSMKINYPNEFDLTHAKADGRQNLGGDIYIHGKALSIGCLAMGDEAAEDLFIITNLVGIQNVKVIIAPYDSRPKNLLIKSNSQLKWLPKLYAEISQELKSFLIK